MWFSEAFVYGSTQSLLDDRYHSVYVKWTSYKDVPVQGSGTPKILSSSYDVEYDYRIYNPFSIVVSFSKALDDSREGGGVGMRVDLPGFFFYKKSRFDLFRSSKAQPLNSSVFFITSWVSQKNKGIKTLDSRFGGAVEAFIYNELFFVGEMGAYVLDGEGFLFGALGLGYEF